MKTLFTILFIFFLLTSTFFIPYEVLAIDFETPPLDTSSAQVINPYTADGVTFTTPVGNFGDEVVGLVKNNSTSACAEPADDNQKLGTGRDTSIGLSGFEIQATFAQPLAPSTLVSVEFQTGGDVPVRIRLFDASDTLVAESIDTIPANGGTCGFPGDPRGRITLSALSEQAVAYAIMDLESKGYVFVIDNFELQQPIAFPEIEVHGNGIAIVDGDTTPARTDHTDYDSIKVGDTFVRSFTLRNIGKGALQLTQISLSGTGCSPFLTTVPPVSVLEPDGSIPIQISFSPKSEGTFKCTVNIENDDSDEGLYTFALMGTGQTASTPLLSPTQPLPATMMLTINLEGSGRITSTPKGIRCTQHDAQCQHIYNTATWVTLTATPTKDSKFIGWGGQTDCADGKVYLTANRYCTAYFQLLPRTLAVNVTGQGSVVSHPNGIQCNERGGLCIHDFASGAEIALTATAATGWQLKKWAGGCNENGHVLMKRNSSCRVTFVPAPPLANDQSLFDGMPISQHELLTLPEDIYLTPDKKRIDFKRLKEYLFVMYKTGAIPLALFDNFMLPDHLNPFEQGNIYKFAHLNRLEQATEHFKHSEAVEYISPLLTSKGQVLSVVSNKVIVKRETGEDEALFINALDGKRLQEKELRYISKLRLSENKYLFDLLPPENNAETTFNAVHSLNRSAPIEWAEADFLSQVIFDNFEPNDPCFHHRPCTPLESSTEVGQQHYLSEIKVPEAWDIVKGKGITIAINDSGVKIDHDDLKASIWENDIDTSEDHNDDDNNGYIDDIQGWNFSDNNPDVVDPYYHGTAVAGTAAAQGDNGIGIAGVAMEATILPIVKASSCSRMVESLLYEAKYADIANHSWEASEDCSTSINDAITDVITGQNIVGGTLRGHLGTVLLFSSGKNEGEEVVYPASNADVIAVGTTEVLNHGEALDVVAPGDAILTTCGVGVKPEEYCNYFEGTSAATPIVAGVAALILSAQPNLTYLQVQRLLQDTAAKIDPQGGAYDPNTGKSTAPYQYGWGQVNAFEAVRVVAPSEKNGVDIFFRDNELDWGNTPTPARWWNSMDIKVDAPPVAQNPPTTGADFDLFPDEKPTLKPGEINKVYVRVHNRGPDIAHDIEIKLYWTQFGTALPAFPSADWHLLKCVDADPICDIDELHYSGSSVAGGETDAAQIVSFNFEAPPYDESRANHFCLVAMAEAREDKILALTDSSDSIVIDELTPEHNNVTHRNYLDLDRSQITSTEQRFMIRNPYKQPIESLLTLEAPQDWSVTLNQSFAFNQAFTLKPRESILLTMKTSLPQSALSGKINIIQNRLMSSLRRSNQNTPELKVMGGITLQIHAETDETFANQKPVETFPTTTTAEEHTTHHEETTEDLPTNHESSVNKQETESLSVDDETQDINNKKEIEILPAHPDNLTTPPLIASPDISTPICPNSGFINWVCTANGQHLTQLTIGKKGSISNGVLIGSLNNQGWVSNLTIEASGQLEGGIVTGYITNRGTMANFEFRGALIKGGTLAGQIINASPIGGYFQDVHLAANTHIYGGKLQGRISGEAQGPALLEHLDVKKGSRLQHVIIGQQVKLLADVIQENVR